jgi:hypothetical protein
MNCPDCDVEMTHDQDIRVTKGHVSVVLDLYLCDDCDEAFRLVDGRLVRESDLTPVDELIRRPL